jgi:sugar O-acyltransferase (sialic acid O-acetyltransferase NeuD family)
MRIAIFGGKGGGEIAAHSFVRLAEAWPGAALAGYLNDQLAPGTALLGGTVLGAFSTWTELPRDVRFVAPLHKAKEMPERHARVRGLGLPDERWATLIDPAAIVAPDASIGAGSVLGPLAVVGPSCVLGRHVACWAAAQVGHDVTVGDFVFLGRGSIVSGYCSIASGAYLGSGAVVRERCRVGEYAVVGAGAVVIADVPDGTVVAGNPARAIGTIEVSSTRP